MKLLEAKQEDGRRKLVVEFPASGFWIFKTPAKKVTFVGNRGEWAVKNEDGSLGLLSEIDSSWLGDLRLSVQLSNFWMASGL